MPMYTYQCGQCEDRPITTVITKIDSRDSQYCEGCGYRLTRKVDRPGGVWAPTSTGGGMKV